MGDSGDFIFTKRADGSLEFKGDFEGLYQADPDPWGQSGEHPRMKEYYAFSRRHLAAGLTNLYFYQQPKSILEVGCGNGHLTGLLHRCFATCEITGMDISPTAVKHARELFRDHGIKFFTADLCAPVLSQSLRKWYDVVILSQMLWYVLDRFAAALGNASSLLKAGRYLVIQNAFLDNQEYGREVVDGFNGLLKYVLDHHASDFQVVSASYDASSRFAPYHDGLLVLQSTR